MGRYCLVSVGRTEDTIMYHAIMRLYDYIEQKNMGGMTRKIHRLIWRENTYGQFTDLVEDKNPGVRIT